MDRLEIIRGSKLVKGGPNRYRTELGSKRHLRRRAQKLAKKPNLTSNSTGTPAGR